MKSFKSRILVWTLGISSLVLVAFAVSVDRSFYQLQLKHIDDGLRTLAPPRFHPPGQRNFWHRFEGRLRDEGLRILNTDVRLVVYGRDVLSDTLWLGEPIEGLLNRLPVPTRDLPPISLGDRSPELESTPPPPPPRNGGARSNRRSLRDEIKVEPSQLSFELAGKDWRFLLYELDGYNIAMGVDLGDATRSLSELRKTFLIGMPLALALLGVVSWFFARKAIEPITKLTAVANSITASDLSVRIAGAREDKEFADLIAVFNNMLDRLDRSFEQARRFSADAAHELKTPLAILQGQLENAIQSAPEGSEVQAELGSLVEETHRLKSITRKLLLLAQADTGKLPINRVKVNFFDLVSEAFDSVVESEGEVQLVWERSERFEIDCDVSLVSQIVRNLASNAIKYRSKSESPILLSVFAESGNGNLFVRNECEPIGRIQRSKLFDRFSRIDSARNRSTDGTGLGLSLSREFARAHGGDLLLAEFRSEEEIEFRLQIPH